jgi:uncharacterized protein with ParB-like and HNH nuclease domain
MEAIQNKFTPETISKSDKLFSIPLYQRLFEWDKKQIQQLLKDLYTSYKLPCNRPYYIGLLTVYVEPWGSLSLVDGQQRFTVLSLMALAFENKFWNDFLTINEKPRLTFTSRKSDNDYLLALINKDINYKVNKKMAIAIEVIKTYVAELCETERNEFINYIFKNATFFISELPESYRSQDLNRYFESMNAAGKGLENHEILKVDLLKLLPDSEKDFCTKIWNAVSEMDKCLIRQKTWHNETVDNYRKRFYNALDSFENKHILFSHCNDSEKELKDQVNATIREIQETDKPPGKQITSQSDRAILSFEEFLLQILYIQFFNSPEVTGIDFFNTHKLQQTFHKILTTPENVLLFTENLLKYRIVFDYYITRVSFTDNNSVSYTLNFHDNSNSLALSRLKQFQSMLYVSTSSHLWLTKTLIYLFHNKVTDADLFLTEVKNIDNKRHSNIGFLNYGSVDRYWFWRLDYYLWENRAANFTDKLQDIADKYIFKANRSIEHIAPQNPKRESNVEISENDLHSFGNLAMISSGQNSALQNESFEVKRAYVESYINGSKGGSIESLKMLKIYEFDNWNNESIVNHENEMIKVLKDSFKTEYSAKPENI